MKYTTPILLTLLITACAPHDETYVCPVYLGEGMWAEGPCSDDPTGTISPTDPEGPTDPTDPEGPTDPTGTPKHGNKGHGNGDEGDCRGSGCRDADNPGKGHK